MFEEYQLKVLNRYREMIISTDCPTVLKMPSPAALRDFCVAFLVTSYTDRDKRVLTDFFGGFSTKEELVSLVKVVDVDRFRPVISFMKEKTSNPSTITVELLAWLIDFKARPYFSVWQNEELIPDDETSNQSNEKGNGGLSDRGTLLIRNKLKIRLLLVSIIFIFGLYFLVDKTYYEGKTPSSILSENFARNQCMYWNDTRYVSIACDSDLQNRLIIAADYNKITHFKMITKPDTLTEEDIGKIWYSKIRNRVEFFTGPGVHPEHRDRHLKPLTLYMLRKYAKTGSM